MTQQSGANPASSSFAEHVREFHRSLPNEEKQMLEQVFALAEAASMAVTDQGEEAKGYALVDYFAKIESQSLQLSGNPGAAKLEPPSVKLDNVQQFLLTFAFTPKKV